MFKNKVNKANFFSIIDTNLVINNFVSNIIKLGF